ncbi:MAG: hypothetical protein ACI33S_03145 [Bacilli bacterium]
MKFEDEIKLLSDEIYKKVVKFINENKEDDDLYHAFAYLKLSNGMQIMFRFDNATLYVTNSHEKGTYGVLDSLITIQDYETKYKLNDIEFETFLNEKIKKRGNDRCKNYYKFLLDKQQKLTEQQKEEIKKVYIELNKAVDFLSYDVEKTRTIDNFNDSVFDIFVEYMYEKELNNLKNSSSEFFPAVEVAVDWWTKVISSDSRSGSIGENTYNKFLMNFSEMLFPTTPISEEQISKFKYILSQKIMSELCKNKGEVVQMECDYAPCLILFEALNEAGIDPNRVPYKTDLYIRPYFVGVKEGYGSKNLIIFDSTEKDDIQKTKNRYCEMYHITPNDYADTSCSKVLKRNN